MPQHRKRQGCDDTLAPDGYVRIGRQMSAADSMYFSIHCAGAAGCHRQHPLSIHAAFRLLGCDPWRSVQSLRRRLVCSVCGGRWIVIDVRVDTRPAELRVTDGLLPETRADLTEPEKS